MLKDKFLNFFNNSKKEKDPLKVNIMDGFVNIKGYKVNKDGSKKLVYHDCGDNVVTDWMRHAIMILLTGDSFLSKGNNKDFNNAEESRNSSTMVTMFNKKNHQTGKNLDGYLMNGREYLWTYDDGKKGEPLKYSKSNVSGDGNVFAVFPTKVLFGTGKEYSSWEVLQSENEVANASWYEKMLTLYGNGKNLEEAKLNFNGQITSLACNTFSGSITEGVLSGDGKITPMRTVNSPETSSDTTVISSSMNKNYGVVGAIKTPYFSPEDSSFLDETTTESGQVLQAKYRGVGRPCFIYFDVPKKQGEGPSGLIVNEGWDDPTSDVYLDKDSSSKYINKITFKINMPAQSATGTIGEYYPYNGYTLRQMGLYNDAQLVNGLNITDKDDETVKNNMPCGTLLAIKNIASLDKTADIELVMTWTLTI